MSEQDVAILRTAYAAFNRGNVAAVLEAFDEQIEWTEPGGGKAPRGTFHGPASVASDVFATIPEQFDEFQARPERFIDAGDGRVVVTGSFRGRTRDGQALDAPFAHVWQMRDDKATRFEHYVAVQPWTNAWGG